MPIMLDGELKRVNASPKIEAIKCENHSLLVWWYCGVLKNKNDQFQPLAKVAFRRQIKDRTFSDDIVYREVPLEHLGQLRIGSLCKNNRVVAVSHYKEQDFYVNHEKDWYWFSSFHNEAKKSNNPPYPANIYPLHFKHDRNQLLCFKLNSGGNLVIPTLEYFSRCYGSSGKVRRYLTTRKWGGHDGLPMAFFEPVDQPEQFGKWIINIKKGFYNGDTVFLAHLKYDRYTQVVVKLIYSELEAQYKNGRQIPAFPKIGPWFQGKGVLRVRGIPFNEGKSFLGLQITGISEPAGLDIDRLRDNRNNAANPAEPEAEGQAWAGAPNKNTKQRPEIIDLSTYEAPDQSSAIHELEDPKIQMLGKRRKIISLHDEQAHDKGSSNKSSSNNGRHSSGDPHGNGKGVDQASIHAPEAPAQKKEMESEGALRDIWNAALLLKKTYQPVTKVEWYTPTDGFVESTEPKLMALSPYGEKETFNGIPIPTKTRNWSFIDPDNSHDARGVLVIRLTINNRYVYVLEIQRRVRKARNGSDKEESLRGFVFTLSTEEQFDPWIKLFCSNVRKVEGIVHKLTSYCPGEADVFKHTSSSNDEIPCWKVLHNALKKVGINLK